MKTKLRSFICSRSSQLIASICLAIFSLITPHASGTDVSTLKLFGRWTNTPTSFALGAGNGFDGVSPNALACTESWIVAGAPQAAEHTGIGSEGAAQVFNAATGTWVRKLLPPAPATASTLFGFSCAVSGNLAAIGAVGVGADTGAVYVYDLTSGKLKNTLAPGGDGAPGDRFGCAVAISGDWVVVGAYGDDTNQGSAYFFNLKSNTHVKVQAADGAAGHYYGASVAAEGNIALIGSPKVDSSKGAAYAYDLATQTLISKIQPAAAAAGDEVGYSLAMTQGRAVLGAPYANGTVGKIYVVDLLTGTQVTLTGSDVAAGEYLGRDVAAYQNMVVAGSPYQNTNLGALYVYDLNAAATTEFKKLTPPDGGAGRFGIVVALAGNAVVTAAPYDSNQAASAGAIYLMRPITRPMPLTLVTAKGDFAPGAPDINFNIWNDAYLNRDGEISFVSTLSGYGSNGGKDTGIFNTMGASGLLDLVLKSRQVDTQTIASVSSPLINRPNLSIFRAVLSGTGVTGPMDNQAIYKDDGATTTRVLRTGGTASVLYGGGVPLGFTQITQSRNVDRLAATFTLRNGVAATTANNDTGLLWYDMGTSLGETVPPREGGLAGATGLTYGQFTGRIAYYHNRALYATAVAGATSANQAVFQKDYNVAETVLAQKGDVPPAPGGAPFSAFIGESVEDTPVMLYRATLGAPAPTATNEGLWTGPAGSSTLVMLKGVDLAPALPGVKIAKFINFWEVFGQTLALVQLSGTGVTAANDQAVLLYQTSSVAGLTVLMREGEPAPGCNGATIGVINRVEVETFFGEYGVLATLAGVPAGTNQALFRGFSHKSLTGASQQSLRRPVLVLRKGTLFNNQPGKVKSIAMSTTNLTAAGAGSTGLGRVFQEGSGSAVYTATALTIDFDNGVRQLMKGIP